MEICILCSQRVMKQLNYLLMTMLPLSTVFLIFVTKSTITSWFKQYLLNLHLSINTPLAHYHSNNIRIYFQNLNLHSLNLFSLHIKLMSVHSNMTAIWELINYFLDIHCPFTNFQHQRTSSNQTPMNLVHWPHIPPKVNIGPNAFISPSSMHFTLIMKSLVYFSLPFGKGEMRKPIEHMKTRWKPPCAI